MSSTGHPLRLQSKAAEIKALRQLLTGGVMSDPRELTFKVQITIHHVDYRDADEWASDIRRAVERLGVDVDVEVDDE